MNELLVDVLEGRRRKVECLERRDDISHKRLVVSPLYFTSDCEFEPDVELETANIQCYTTRQRDTRWKESLQHGVGVSYLVLDGPW